MYASSTLDLRLYLSGRTGHRARFPTALTTFFLHTGLASCESARALQNFAAKRAPACSPRLIFLVPREGLLLFTLLYLSYPSFRRRSGSPRETLGNSRLDWMRARLHGARKYVEREGGVENFPAGYRSRSSTREALNWSRAKKKGTHMHRNDWGRRRRGGRKAKKVIRERKESTGDGGRHARGPREKKRRLALAAALRCQGIYYFVDSIKSPLWLLSAGNWRTWNIVCKWFSLLTDYLLILNHPRRRGAHCSNFGRNTKRIRGCFTLVMRRSHKFTAIKISFSYNQRDFVESSYFEKENFAFKFNVDVFHVTLLYTATVIESFSVIYKRKSSWQSACS